MKTYYLSILFLLFAASAICRDGDTLWVSKSNKQISINTLAKDFGVVVHNDKRNFKFELTNLDTSNLVIWHVTASCGCTTPTWTEKPVKQGENALVKVKYDSSIIGVFSKSIMVYTNFDDKPIKLIIMGKVVPNKTETEISKQSSNFKGEMPQISK